MVKKSEKKGGKLSARELKGLIDKSYDKENTDFGDWKVDPSLSDPEVKVFTNDKTGKTAVVHRGTYSANDWYLDSLYARGKDITNSRRYKHSADIQKKAEEKYGADNVTTVGHSLGKKLAEVGKNSHEIIGLNGATNITDALKPTADNEFNVRSSGDVVSGLLAPKDKNILTIPSASFNPLTEHQTGILDRVDPDTQIGRGHIAKLPKKHLKSLIKGLPKKKGDKYNITGKSKKDLVDYCCDACGLD